MRIVCFAILLLVPMKLLRVKSAAAWHAAYTLLVGSMSMPRASCLLPMTALGRIASCLRVITIPSATV